MFEKSNLKIAFNILYIKKIAKCPGSISKMKLDF